jgi:hypothetical protein
LDPFWEITRPGYSRGQIPLLIDVSDEDRDLAFVNIQKAARHYGVNLSVVARSGYPPAEEKKSATRRVMT